MMACSLKFDVECQMQGDIAHVVVMPNITITLLEEFMNDLIGSRSQVPIV